MQVFGNSSLTSQHQAVVNYEDPEIKNPASIVFVLDNSGSMWFDDLPIDNSTGSPPAEAVRRIAALSNSFNAFNQKFRDLGADSQTGDEKYLRTAMITYNSGTVYDPVLGQYEDHGPAGAIKDQIDMAWSTIPEYTVADFYPFGGTNSAPAMQEALNIMENEDTAHENGSNLGETPNKFVILMSDGQNTDSNPTWYADNTSNKWRRPETGTYQECTNWEWVRRGRRWWRGYWRCTNYQTITYNTGNYEYWDSNIDGVLEGRTEPAGSGWERGREESAGDNQTRQICDDLKDEDVEVYTIGFALIDGNFQTNDWSLDPNVPGGGGPGIVNVDPSTLERAMSVLQYCATSEEHFLLADDQIELELAFETIGNTILEDVIRVKS